MQSQVVVRPRTPPALRRRQRLMGAGVAAGAGFLLGRTIALIAGGSLTTMVGWAAALLVAEFVVDATAVGLALRWALTGARAQAAPALRALAAVIVLHAVRVAVFVLGRTGPWVDFDVRPEHRPDHAETWSWTGVVVAAVGAALSVVVLVIVWHRRRRR